MNNLKLFSPSNGVKLCLMPYDIFKTSVVSVSMSMPLETRVEERALLAYILKRCSAEYDDITKINRKLAELYGAVLSSGVSKKGEAQVMTFSITCVDDKFSLTDEKISEEGMKLLLDLIFKPKLVDGMFAKQDVETQKRLLVEAIDGEFSEKRTYALGRAEEEMCKNEMYATKRYGKRDRILQLTPEEVTVAWKEMIEKAIVQINVVGSSAGENILKEVENRFENIDRSNLCEIKTEYVVSSPEENYVSQKQPVKQGKLVIGLRAGMTNKNDNNYALHVMTDILGGGPYSKLFMNVREKMSLCYYCSARFVRAKGIIMIQSGIEQENEEKAINAIKQQIEDMKNGNFTKDDFENSIKGITDSCLSLKDTPDGIDSWYAGQYCDGSEVKFESPEEYVENIKKVTTQQVQVAAQGVSIDTIYMLKSNSEQGEE